MPPRNKFTKDEIILSAVNIVRRNGVSALTARSLAGELGSSSKVIFGLFENMDDLQREVLVYADNLYQKFIADDIASGKYPPYKASGMAYIRFAMEEKELFRILFMRDRSREDTDDTASIEPIIEIIQKSNGLTREDALLLHLEMWSFVHGIAVMYVTGYCDFGIELVSSMATDIYRGLCHRFANREEG